MLAGRGRRMLGLGVLAEGTCWDGGAQKPNAKAPVRGASHEGHAMEIVVLFIVVAGIVWIVWKVRADVRASRNADLEHAWRVVLDDPNYAHRRRFEERKREDEARARKEEGV